MGLHEVSCHAAYGMHEHNRRVVSFNTELHNHAITPQAWTNVFPRQNILFLRNEDYQAAPREHLAAVLKFLGEKSLHYRRPPSPCPDQGPGYVCMHSPWGSAMPWIPAALSSPARLIVRGQRRTWFP